MDVDKVLDRCDVWNMLLPSSSSSLYLSLALTVGVLMDKLRIKQKQISNQNSHVFKAT